jgi:hypothetical protein
MNQHKQITPKGVHSIFQVLCQADPRIASFRLGDFASTETSGEDQYPMVMIDIVDSQLVTKGTESWTQWNVKAYSFTQRRQDWGNVIDEFSQNHIILNDLVLRFQKEKTFKELGIRFNDNVTFDYIVRSDRDDLVGVAADIRFTSPLRLNLCDGDLIGAGTLPDLGLYYSAATASSQLTCGTLSQCEVIASIRQDIWALRASTGSTETFNCEDLLGCGVFTDLQAYVAENSSSIMSLSGDSISLSSSIVSLSGSSLSMQENISSLSSSLTQLSGDTAGLFNTFVQPGSNIVTGGTASHPVINVSLTPTFNSVGASMFFSGGTNLQDIFGASTPTIVTINNQTGTSYTLQSSDVGPLKLLRQSNAAAIVTTIPTNAAVPLPIGSIVSGIQSGVGQVTLVGSIGVTLNSLDGALKVIGQYAAWTGIKVGTDTWAIMGSMTT